MTQTPGTSLAVAGGKTVGGAGDPAPPGSLLQRGEVWLAIGLMVVVSKATAASVPADIRMKMLVLHAPEQLGLKQEYIQEHSAGAGH